MLMGCCFPLNRLTYSSEKIKLCSLSFSLLKYWHDYACRVKITIVNLNTEIVDKIIPCDTIKTRGYIFKIYFMPLVRADVCRTRDT